jgi:hypothetical protein
VAADIDGDSLAVIKEGEAEEVRLYGIHCRKKTRGPRQAGEGVCLGMVFVGSVEMELFSVGRYGRIEPLFSSYELSKRRFGQ